MDENTAKQIIPLLRIHDVCKVVGLGKTKIYDLVRNGTFPAPVALTKRSRAWRADSIQDWIDNRPKANIQGSK